MGESLLTAGTVAAGYGVGKLGSFIGKFFGAKSGSFIAEKSGAAGGLIGAAGASVIEDEYQRSFGVAN